LRFLALFLFLSFGVMALTMLGERATQRLREGRPFVAMAWGVALAWLANLNMWAGWHVTNLRYEWVGVTLTGIALGGTAVLLYALVGFFAGLFRKFDDEAEQIERRQLTQVEPLSKVS
jgi:hypothetical protein